MSSPRPISRTFLNDLHLIKYEVQHKGFENICDYAGWAQDRIIRKLSDLDLQYGLTDIKFSTECGITRYQIRKIKDSRRIRKA